MKRVELTRRHFLIATAAGVVLGRAGLRLRITGSTGRLGADLGIEEMTRTAALLGQTLQLTDAADSTIDLEEGRLLAAGAAFYATASEAMRRAALAAWRQDHGEEGDRAVEWHADLERFGAGELNERYFRRFKARMDAAAWIGWVLVKIFVEAALRSVNLADARIDGHKGVPLLFGPDGRLIQPLCIIDKSGRLLGMVQADQVK